MFNNNLADGGRARDRAWLTWARGAQHYQLPYAKAELSTHDNQRVTKVVNDGLQAALTGTKTVEQAMKDAQRESERILRSYKK